MIYEAVDEQEPIKQGDIFRDLPRIDVSLDEMAVLARDRDSESIVPREMSWTDILDDEEATEVTVTDEDHRLRIVRAILPVCPVQAIVITQSCDCLRADDLSLCEIAPLHRVLKDAANITSMKRWVKTLTKQGSEHVRWFYLPPNEYLGSGERMAVDFRSVLRLPRPHVENLKSHRVGRLNRIAYEHFREKLAEFFRRYPYDPWYPLNKEEFQTYAEGHEGVKPFPWQQ